MLILVRRHLSPPPKPDIFQKRYVSEQNHWYSTHSAHIAKINMHEMQARAQVVQTKEPEMQAKVANRKNDVPEMQARATFIQAEVPEMQARAMSIQADVPEMQARGTFIQADVPETQARATFIQAEAPEMQTRDRKKIFRRAAGYSELNVGSTWINVGPSQTLFARLVFVHDCFGVKFNPKHPSYSNLRRAFSMSAFSVPPDIG